MVRGDKIGFSRSSALPCQHRRRHHVIYIDQGSQVVPQTRTREQPLGNQTAELLKLAFASRPVYHTWPQDDDRQSGLGLNPEQSDFPLSFAALIGCAGLRLYVLVDGLRAYQAYRCRAAEMHEPPERIFGAGVGQVFRAGYVDLVKGLVGLLRRGRDVPGAGKVIDRVDTFSQADQGIRTGDVRWHELDHRWIERAVRRSFPRCNPAVYAPRA